MVDRSALEGDTGHPGPDEIWLRASAEGEHRLQRTRIQLLATGLLGGFDIMFGALAMVLVGSAVLTQAGAELAFLAGALAFGIGLAFISIGRSELFTENFLVPTVALVRNRGTGRQLVRLWVLTLAGNALGIIVLAFVLNAAGIVDKVERNEFVQLVLDGLLLHGGWTETFATAVLAGMVMTLFTWLLHATTDDVARITLAIGVAVLLIAPPLTHVVVAGAELAMAMVVDAPIDAGDAGTTLALALVGNIVGGVLFVTLARSAQVLSWPKHR